MCRDCDNLYIFQWILTEIKAKPQLPPASAGALPKG